MSDEWMVPIDDFPALDKGVPAKAASPIFEGRRIYTDGKGGYVEYMTDHIYDYPIRLEDDGVYTTFNGIVHRCDPQTGAWVPYIPKSRYDQPVAEHEAH